MIRFREEAGLSQAQAGDLSGIALDAIRRYETGTTATVPGTALSELAKLYGHAMDDFFMTKPPKPRLDEAPVLFLRARPGADIDQAVYTAIQDMIDKANKDMRGKKPKK
jgi:transcriptional regulator with XRE-family HTH domain